MIYYVFDYSTNFVQILYIKYLNIINAAILQYSDGFPYNEKKLWTERLYQLNSTLHIMFSHVVVWVEW